jgi:uncharacterized protein with NRDE domain
MCLVAIAWQVHPRYPLIVLGNRDEQHARPAAGADWWHDAPDILGGRDLKAGGSWLAVHRSGRVAVVTNYPGRPAPAGDAPSRGNLVREFVAAGGDVANFFSTLGAHEARYAGFSLLAATPLAAGLFAAGGETANLPALDPGVHALSNSPLDDPWPKVGWLTRRLGALLGTPGEPTTSDLLDLLMHRGPVADDTGLPSVASRPFVVGDDYGTRASTVVLVHRDGQVRFSERRHGPGGSPAGESHFAFEIRPEASPAAALPLLA